MYIQELGKICHEANRAYCASGGDHDELPWEQASYAHRDSTYSGVVHRLLNPDEPVSNSHAQWVERKKQQGWRYGEVEDAVLKTHPLLVPYEQLTPWHQGKDALYCAIIDAARTPDLVKQATDWRYTEEAEAKRLRERQERGY